MTRPIYRWRIAGVSVATWALALAVWKYARIEEVLGAYLEPGAVTAKL